MFLNVVVLLYVAINFSDLLNLLVILSPFYKIFLDLLCFLSFYREE